MNQSVLIQSESLRLSLDFEVFEEELSLPSNTLLSVSLTSDCFSASTSLDLDAKELPAFLDALRRLYDSLQGEAVLQEPYGQRQYLSFRADGLGHVAVSGRLHSCGAGGHFQELRFENDIDQTYLPPLLAALTSLTKQTIS